MWFDFEIVCIFVTFIGTGNGIKNVLSTILQLANWSEGKFGDSVSQQFPNASFQISSNDGGRTFVKAVTVPVNDRDSIFLKDIKFAADPELEITLPDSNLEFFSTRVTIESEALVFLAKIYINEGTRAVGGARYTMRNFKAVGLVGLDLREDGKFVSTNYLINNQQHDQAELEPNWIKEYGKFSDNQLRKEINELIRSTLKKRLDFALSKISPIDIFGIRETEVFEKKKELEDFYNKVLDELLVELNARMADNEMSEIALPDIDMPLTYDVGLINLYGQFVASKGWLRNLATFVRRAGVSLSFESAGNFVIFSSLGLQELRLGYGVCSLKIGGIGPSGNICGKIGDNEAQVGILISVENGSMNLTHFEITKLNDIGVELTGFGPLNWLASKIAGIVLNRIKSDVVPLIEPIIKQEIDKILTNQVATLARRFEIFNNPK